MIKKERKYVEGLKISKGYKIGCKVNMSGERMWELFERMINIDVNSISELSGM